MKFDGSEFNLRRGISIPMCQVAGCFEPAMVYIVIRETDDIVLDSQQVEQKLDIAWDHEPKGAVLLGKNAGEPAKSEFSDDINTFKLILYLCARHDYDLKYLLKENELQIVKRQYLAFKQSTQ